MHFRVGENIFIIQTHVLKALVFYRNLLFSTELHLNNLCGLPKRVHSLHFSCLHQKTSSHNVWMKSRTVLGMSLRLFSWVFYMPQSSCGMSKAKGWPVSEFSELLISRGGKRMISKFGQKEKKKFQICSEYIFSSIEGSNFQKLTTC